MYNLACEGCKEPFVSKNKNSKYCNRDCYKKYKVVWNKGKENIYSAETLKKMHDKKIGRKLNDAHRLQIQQSMKKYTGENNPAKRLEVRQKIRKKATGRVLDEVTKNKISDTIKKKYSDGYVNPFKNKSHSIFTKQLISNKNKGNDAWNQGLTKETNEIIEQYSHKCGWSKGKTKYDHPGLLKMSISMASKESKKCSNEEIDVLNTIKELGYAPSRHKQIEYYNPDFVFEDKKKIIEFNGCYYHGCKYCHPQLRENKNNILKDHQKVEKNLKIEKLRHVFLYQKGYKILYIWECEWRNKKEETKQKIVRFLEDG